MRICVWSNLSSWTMKHQLQGRTTCYLYIRVIVKKTEREKVSYMELFVKSEEILIYLCFVSVAPGYEKTCLLSVAGFETQF